MPTVDVSTVSWEEWMFVKSNVAGWDNRGRGWGEIMSITIYCTFVRHRRVIYRQCGLACESNKNEEKVIARR